MPIVALVARIGRRKKAADSSGLKTTFQREEPMKSVEGNRILQRVSCLSQPRAGHGASMLAGSGQRPEPWPSSHPDRLRTPQRVQRCGWRRSGTLQPWRVGKGTMRTKRKRWQYPWSWTSLKPSCLASAVWWRKDKAERGGEKEWIRERTVAYLAKIGRCLACACYRRSAGARIASRLAPTIDFKVLGKIPVGVPLLAIAAGQAVYFQREEPSWRIRWAGESRTYSRPHHCAQTHPRHASGQWP